MDLRATAANEVAARKAEIAAELAAVVEEIGQVDREAGVLREEHAAAAGRIKDDFRERRRAAARERDDTVLRVAGEKEAAQRIAGEERKKLAAEERDELARANVDTGRLAILRGDLEAAGNRLAAIATWRGEVDAWREFRDGDLARLPLVQEQLRIAERDRDDAQQKQRDAQAALEEHAGALRERLVDLDRLQETYASDTSRLEALLAQELHVIGEPRRATVVQTWSADELAMKVGRERRRLADATAHADDLHRSIRNQMLVGREGPVQDWLLQREDELKPLLEGQADHLATLQRGRLLGQWFEGAAADSINALHIELSGVLAIAAGFVTFLDTFDRKVGGTNTDLRNQLANVKAFPAFRDLDVHIRSSVRDLDYLQTLREMKALSESQVSMSRFSGRAAARQTELPGQDVVALMRSFRDLLNRDSGIRANLSELVRLECSLTINGKALRITDAEEFKRHASNGTTGMIIGMFLMGFAGVVRKRAAAPVRVTWITDEVGRFDSVNLQVFLKTLDENNIDVISARPEADPSTLDLFDTEARFGINGKISTARLGVDEWEAQDVVAA